MYQLREQAETKFWLSQFDHCEKDLELAEKLVDSILYCSLKGFNTDLTKLVKSKLPLNQISALFIERELQPTRAKLPPPIYKQKKTLNTISKKKHKRAYGAAIQAIKSLRYDSQDIGSEALTAHIANKLCRANGQRFLLHPSAENVRKSKVRNFVIITDFIGSGDRARALLDAMWNVASIRSWYSGKFIKFWVMAYSGTAIGVENVRSHRFSPNVHIVSECPTLYNSFGEDSGEMTELCERYGSYSKDPLGWKETAALLAFEHGAPNNMPAIFISGKFRGSRKWTPLFPKRITENLWRSAEVDTSELISHSLKELNIPEIAKSPSFLRSTAKSKLALIILLAHAQGKRRLADLRRVLPLPLDILISAKERAVNRGWLTQSGALTLAGQKAIRLLLRQGRKNFVAPDPFAPYHPTQLRAPQ